METSAWTWAIGWSELKTHFPHVYAQLEIDDLEYIPNIPTNVFNSFNISKQLFWTSHNDVKWVMFKYGYAHYQLPRNNSQAHFDLNEIVVLSRKALGKTVQLKCCVDESYLVTSKFGVCGLRLIMINI